MFTHFFICGFLTLGAAEGANSGDLPSWITNNPAYGNPKIIDSIAAGSGTIITDEKNSQAWVVHLNQLRGHGVQVNLEKLNLDPKSNDFLMVAPWPLNPNFKEVKLFTGTWKNEARVHIPNTETFFLLYSSSGQTQSPQLVLSYERYGSSYEDRPPPTDGPVKRETTFEIQLKGKPPEEYSKPELRSQVKLALRAAARRYCQAHGIPFNENIPTQEMVTIRRVSACPFEWPDREICSSLEHAIFVSGVRESDDHIRDYELTADNLRKMWMEQNFPELESLEITVFKLPKTTSTVFWWSLIIGLMAVSSCVASFTFWRMVKNKKDTSSRKSSVSFEPDLPKRKIRLRPKDQVIPPFMYPNDEFRYQEEQFRSADFEDLQREKRQGEDSIFKDSSGLPMNYIGVLLFSGNDDENVEFRRK